MAVVDIEEELIIEFDDVGLADVFEDEGKLEIGAVGKVLHDGFRFGEMERAGFGVAADFEMGESVGRDVFITGVEFVPGDKAVVVGVKRDDGLKVFDGDVPLADGLVGVEIDREIALARVVSKEVWRKDQAGKNEQPGGETGLEPWGGNFRGSADPAENALA